MRIMITAGLVMLVATNAQAGCNPIPTAETPAVLMRAFTERMSPTGTGRWRFATKTRNGGMYYSEGTELNFIIENSGSLISEAGLLLTPLTPADEVRMETAATFLLSRLAGRSEKDLEGRVVKGIASAKAAQQPATVREGEATLVISSPDPKTIVIKAGRLRCD
ncbi:hypothetical protein [Methylobacterium radiotolerans]|uniref:hypothetical protein n=1 Tax=Methylobacterium radiotolerans TaxID=31998 RepID=UPI0015F7865D|nr:hypothetical protein [Methylobacterium radiotolerans]